MPNEVPQVPFVFRANDTIGDPDADRDHKFLEECFVDPGALEVLCDCEASARIVVGRTGAGKTALIFKILKEEEKVTPLNPETLSLNYISNSTILPVLFQLGVNLDLFFDLLWRHVFAIELIKQRYTITDTDQQQTAFSQLLERFSRDETKKKALSYLRKWSDKFWLDADERVKELTDRLEKAVSLKASGGDGIVSRASIEAQATKSEEERRQIVARCQYVINELQANDLSGIVDLVGACLDDNQQRHFIVVDKLDDDWVDNAYKAALVRGLLRSVRAFNKVRSAKIVVALRHDLLDRVFEDENLTAQREKYESLFYDLRWTRAQLVQALDERVNKMVRSRYSRSYQVTHKDILVGSIGKKGGGPSALDYILERTLMRPRDMIAFFNICIKEAGETPKITADVIRRAEREYSRNRLEAIGWEWKLNFPNLVEAAKATLANMPTHFWVSDLDDEQCLRITERLRSLESRPDEFVAIADTYNYANRTADSLIFRRKLLWRLYVVGFVGLKISQAMPWDYAFEGPVRVSEDEIEENTRIAIHKCFWRALGVREGKEFSV